MRITNRMTFLCLCCLLILFVCFTSNAVAATTYTITYKFVSFSADKPLNMDADTLQEKINDFNLPQSKAKKEVIDMVELLGGKSFQYGEFLWKFDSSLTKKKVTIKGDTEITVYWIPEKQNQVAENCQVTFQYDFDSSWRENIATETLRNAIEERFPIPKEKVIPKNTTLNLGEINTDCFGTANKFEDLENDGVWTTAGFKNESGDVLFSVEDDMQVKAIWKFEGKKYPVRYLAVSADETKPFPETLEEWARPANEQTVEKGDWVRAYAPARLEIEDGPGKWVFTGYTRNVLLGQSGDNCFIGKWKYLEKAPQVTYTFVSETGGMKLPKEILQYLPLDTKEYSEGESVKAIEPAEKRFQSKHGEEYTSATNYWKFNGYDANEKIMADGGITFTGKWVCMDEASSMLLIYTSSDENEPIPDELAGRASDDLELFPESGTPELPDDRKVFEDAVGIWTFDRFVHMQSNRNRAAEMVIGYWNFTEKSREVSFSAQSLTAGRELPENIGTILPEKKSVRARETNLIPEEPTETEIRVTGAAWVYRGYQELSIRPGDAPVVFISEWEYVPDEPVNAEICGNVSLSGKKIDGESFEFILVKDNDILEQVKSREDGSFSFSSLSFSADDLGRMPENGFEYQVMEVDGGETKDGTALDGAVQQVTVLLGVKDSKLTVQVIGKPEFKNIYSAEAMVTVNAKVELSGLEFADGILRAVCMKLFSFELYEKDGGNWTLIGSADCDEQGRITLQVPMDHLSTGLHEYQIVQEDQEDQRILIDKRQLLFNLIVTDAGDGTLKVEPVYVGQNLAAVQNIPVTLPELVFVNRVESEMLSVKIEESVSDRNGWQLFANGMPIEVEDPVLSQILTETENEIRFRGLPSYDADGNRILWSVQLATKTDVQIIGQDGEVKDSYYAEDGDTIRSSKETEDQTGTDPSKETENQTGTDSSKEPENQTGTDPSKETENQTGTDSSKEPENQTGTDPSKETENQTGTNSSKEKEVQKEPDSPKETEDQTGTDSSKEKEVHKEPDSPKETEDQKEADSSKETEGHKEPDSPKETEDQTGTDSSKETVVRKEPDSPKETEDQTGNDSSKETVVHKEPDSPKETENQTGNDSSKETVVHKEPDSPKETAGQMENDFSAELILSGTDTAPDIQAQLLKNGKEDDHALVVEKVDEKKYRLMAENLENGQYTAKVEPISGYQIRYTDENGKDGSSAGDGGQIQLVKVPSTGDSKSVLFFSATGLAALCLAICCARRRKNTQG